MRVKLLSAVIITATCEIVAAGETLDVAEEIATDWLKRGIAEKAPPPPPPPPPQQAPTKGKR